MSLSGVMKMKQKYSKFGAFGADTPARLLFLRPSPTQKSTDKPRFSGSC
jgi:hypothetical protein